MLFKVKQIFDECFELLSMKSEDYSNGDLLHTFSLYEKFGVKPEDGILARIVDKVARVSVLLKKERKVKDESIRDTLMDLINYSAILIVLLEDKKKIKSLGDLYE